MKLTPDAVDLLATYPTSFLTRARDRAGVLHPKRRWRGSGQAGLLNHRLFSSQAPESVSQSGRVRGVHGRWRGADPADGRDHLDAGFDGVGQYVPRGQGVEGGHLCERPGGQTSPPCSDVQQVLPAWTHELCGSWTVIAGTKSVQGTSSLSSLNHKPRTHCKALSLSFRLRRVQEG
jgi:hypothetical protein